MKVAILVNSTKSIFIFACICLTFTQILATSTNTTSSCVKATTNVVGGGTMTQGPPSGSTTGSTTMSPPSGNSTMLPPMGSTGNTSMTLPSSGMMQMSMTGTTSTAYTECGTASGSNMFEFTTVTDDASGTTTGFPGGYIQIKTNSCPGYDHSSQTTGGVALEQNRTVKLPLNPKVSTGYWSIGITNPDGSTVTTPSKGAVGIAVNGVALYGNADAINRDAYIYESCTFDQCGGHPTPNQGDYHYHEEPNTGCVYTDTAGQHSPLFGIFYDGIPVYGELGDNGVAPTDLDSCGGHVDKTHPFYHYHLPAGKKFPYFPTCLKGCIYSDNGNSQGIPATAISTVATCKLAATQYDYSSLFSSLKQQPKTAASGPSGTISGTFNSISIFLTIMSFIVYFY